MGEGSRYTTAPQRGRYLTITGQQVEGAPDALADITDTIDWLERSAEARRNEHISHVAAQPFDRATLMASGQPIADRSEHFYGAVGKLKDAGLAIDAAEAAFRADPVPYAQGPLVREAQRHLCQWTLQPLAMLLAEEAIEKLGAPVMIDTLRPVQAFDAGGRSRALSAILDAMARAKEAGLTEAQVNAALTQVNWGPNDSAA